MKKRNLLKTILFISLFIILLSGTVTAHPGRTDGSGGHRDRQNSSGLGNYHYHCGGYPAHLHEDGVCPYSRPKVQQEEEPDDLFSSLFSNDETEDPPVEVKKVNIYSPEGKSLYVGEDITLSATVSPKNAENQTITWKSSDPDIASVDPWGKVTAKSAGKVRITATASTGVRDSYELTVRSYVWWWFWGIIIVVIIAGIIARFLYNRSNL